MKAVVISGNSKSSQWTVEAMRKYFDKVDHLSIKHIDINFSGRKAEVLYRGKPISRYDCMFIKGSFRYAQLLRSIADLFITNDTIYQPYDPQAFTIAHDKLLTQLKLQQKNIPMPRTYLSATMEAAKDILSKMNYPVIMKFPQGTQGKGVMFADSFASASTILDALDVLNQPFIIQEYVETNSCDIRLIVVGDEVVAGMKRKGKSNDKRANIHAGGTGEAFVPDAYMVKIAVEAAKVIGSEICGVDILEGPTGPLIIEVNISPGLQGITGATKIDIADKIARYLYEQTKKLIISKSNDETKKLLAEYDSRGRVEAPEQELITHLDFRTARILLPEFVTKVAGFTEADSVKMKMSKGKVEISKII
jgi:ribosomal protein S6--L-glutamate ligase